MSRRRNYDVGYGRPPDHTKFRKGHSGNPKGRPRKGPTSGGLRHKILNEKVTIRQDGKRRTVSVGEAIYKSLVAKGLSGSIPACKLLLQLEQSAPPCLPSETEVDDLGEDDEALIDRALSRRSGQRLFGQVEENDDLD